MKTSDTWLMFFVLLAIVVIAGLLFRELYRALVKADAWWEPIDEDYDDDETEVE